VGARFKIKILQGIAVTPTVPCGLTIIIQLLSCTCAKNYESWLAVDKVIAVITRLTFWPILIKSRSHTIENNFYN